MAKLDELKVINVIRADLVRKLLAGESWTVDEVFGLIASYIYPMITLTEGNIIFNSDSVDRTGSLKPIYSYIKKIIGKKKKEIALYSKNGLYDYFKQYAYNCKSKEKKAIINLLQESITLIIKGDENGIIVFKDNVHNTYQKLSKVPNNLNLTYGVNEYVVSNQAESGSSIICEYKNNELASAENALTALIKEFNWDKTFPYVWKMGISSNQYERLCKLLKIVFQELQGTGLTKKIKQHSAKLIIYAAEWYRRCYRGNNHDQNLWSDISISNSQNIEKTLWEYTDSPLHKYKKELCYGINSEEFNTQWQRSLFILGGFPLLYTPNTYESFYEEIFDNIDRGISEFEFDQEFNSKVIKHSLSSEDGSLHLLVNAIIEGANEGNFPFFSQEDIENDKSLSQFISKIVDGYKKSNSKKFVLDWFILDPHDETNIIQRCLRITLKPEKNGGFHKLLSLKRMSDWGIDDINNIPSFWLTANFNDSESTYRILKYENRFTGNFVATTHTMNNYVDFYEVPACYINCIDLFIEYDKNDGTHVKKAIGEKHFSCPLGNYIVLYESGKQPGEWTTSVKTGDRCAVLFHDSLECNSPEFDATDGYKHFSIEENSSTYGFVSFSDNLSLIEGEQERRLHCNKGERYTILINPKYKEVIKFTDKNKLIYKERTDSTNAYQEIKLPILCGEKALEVFEQINNNLSNKIEPRKYKLFFKQDEKLFQEWTVANKPKQGVVKIRAQVGETDSSTIECYYIPSGTNYIKRDLNSNCIVIKYSEHLSVWREDTKVTPTPSNGFIHFDCKDAGFSQGEVCQLCIGSEDSHLLMPVFYPFDCEILYQDGEFLTSRKNDASVQLILKDTIVINKLNKEGSQRKKQNYLSYLGFPHSYWECPESRKPIKNDGINYEIAKKWDTYNSIRINKEYAAKYNFYYWTLNERDEPIKLDLDEQECKDDPKYVSLIFKDEDLYRHGIIFQSLINGTPPFYRNWRVNLPNIKSNARPDIELLCKCFEIAKKHKVYFHIFPPLSNLINVANKSEYYRPQVFIDLYLKYAEKYPIGQKELLEFHRLAEEFKFDWILLSINIWSIRANGDESGRNRELMNKLFASNPAIKLKSTEEKIAYNQIINNFLRLPDYQTIRQRIGRNRTAGPFYRSMMPAQAYGDNSYCFASDRSDMDKRRCLLTYLYTDQNAFQNIWEYTCENLLN